MTRKKQNPARKPVTLATIARELNLSPATVSCVLSGRARELKIADKTAERVLDAARRLNYIPNELGRSLRRQRSGIVGVIFGNLYFGWAQDVLNGIQEVLAPRDYVPFVAVHNWSIERERAEVRALLERRAEGVICMPLPGGEESYAELVARGIQLVFLGDTLDSMPEVSFAAWNSGPAAATVVEHLIARGRRRIAFIGPDHPTRITRQRYEAYVAALRAAGLPRRDEWTAWEPEDRSPEEMVHAALTRMFASDVERPDAIFFLNDGLAMPGLSVLKNLGIAVPDQVAVAGMGDLPETRHALIGLTTVAEPTHEMGQRAARIMLEQLSDEAAIAQQQLIDGNDLKVRLTSGPPGLGS